MMRLFIGYDPREAVVYHACVNSIVRQASQPLAITPLALKNLRSYTERHRDGSNQFTYSRFLVPHLTGWAGWALYIDGDMLLRDDIAEIFKLRDETKAVLCVHHDYKTKLRKKYLGARNEDYPRKNWSSVMLWNCAHPANRVPDSGVRADRHRRAAASLYVARGRADRRAAQGMELAARRARAQRATPSSCTGRSARPASASSRTRRWRRNGMRSGA